MKKRLIIIEDEVIIAENLKRMVTKLGFEVLYVYNTYQDALTAVGQEINALYLIDINLNSPEGTGIDIAKKLNYNQNFGHIYVTANADEKTIAAAKKTQPLGYITKPFRGDQLFSTLEIAFHNFSTTGQK